MIKSGIAVKDDVSVASLVLSGGFASGEGGGREPVEDAMLTGRRESGVFVREVGAESSARVMFARRELRKAAWIDLAQWHVVSCAGGGSIYLRRS